MEHVMYSITYATINIIYLFQLIFSLYFYFMTSSFILHFLQKKTRQIQCFSLYYSNTPFLIEVYALLGPLRFRKLVIIGFFLRSDDSKHKLASWN